MKPICVVDPVRSLDVALFDQRVVMVFQVSFLNCFTWKFMKKWVQQCPWNRIFPRWLQVLTNRNSGTRNFQAAQPQHMTTQHTESKDSDMTSDS